MIHTSRTLLQNVRALLLGLVLAIYWLEAIGITLAGWNLWIHRAGVDADRLDAIYVAVCIVAMMTASILNVLAFVLEYFFSRHFFYAIVVGALAILIRVVLVMFSLTIDAMPWTAQILSGKRFDIIVGIGAAIFWLGIIYFYRKRLRQSADPT